MSNNESVDLYKSTYGNFEAEVLKRVREKTFGKDFGQNSWTTGDEYRRWAEWLRVDSESRVVEIASGSGGPALFLSELTGCQLTGVDINELGVNNAAATAESRGMSDRVSFQMVDADGALPFPDESFEALICVDAANHFMDRESVLADWHRILKPGGRALWTDPVVVSGLVTNQELALRSSIGMFVFAPPGLNETLIEQAGFEIDSVEDVSGNAALVAGNWADAREDDREALLKMEGEERFEGLQRFLRSVQDLTASRRLSRIAYRCVKPS